jgi:hypothetical protein
MLLFALHASTQSSITTRRSAEREYQIHLVATEFLSRLRRIPFGSPTDPTASPDQLTELFDDDDDLGSITLSQLVHSPLESGYSFTMVTPSFSGTWQVRVVRDLNGDGDLDDARESRNDIVRVALRLNDRRIMNTLRAAEASATTADTGIDYLGGGG